MGLGFWILFGFGCAKQPGGKTLPKSKEPEVVKPVETPLPKMPEVFSPKREASQRIVHVGEGYLERGQVDKAVQTFQEAINVDIENGVAYYFLAKALYQKGDYDDALGLLERAEVLFSNDQEWMDEVTRLEAMIKEAKEMRPAEKPTGQEVYY